MIYSRFRLQFQSPPRHGKEQLSQDSQEAERSHCHLKFISAGTMCKYIPSYLGGGRRELRARQGCIKSPLFMKLISTEWVLLLYHHKVRKWNHEANRSTLGSIRSTQFPEESGGQHREAVSPAQRRLSWAPGFSGCKAFALSCSQILIPPVRSVHTYRCSIIFILLVVEEDVFSVTTQNGIFDWKQ